MHRPLSILALVVLATTAFAQSILGYDLFDPVAQKIDSGPLRIETRNDEGELLSWFEYDQDGLLVRSFTDSNALAYVTNHTVEVDHENKLITVAEPIPEDARVSSLRFPRRTFHGYLDRLSVHGEQRRQLEVRESLRGSEELEDLTASLEITLTLSRPYTSTFTYQPNKVIETRTWPDERVVETLTYHYGQHGLTRITHDGFAQRAGACFEYDEQGNRVVESYNCDNPERHAPNIVYDEKGRITALPTESVTIAYQEAFLRPTTITITRDDGITVLTYHRRAGRIEFTSSDTTGLQPAPSTHLITALLGYGIYFPYHPYYLLDVAGLTNGTITLDVDKRVTEVIGQTTEGYPSHITASYGRTGHWIELTVVGVDLFDSGTPSTYREHRTISRQ